MQINAYEVVKQMWNAVQNKIREDPASKNQLLSHPSSMLHDAARGGNVEFLRILLYENPELLRMIDDGCKTSILNVAVENRQRDVFNLIYDMDLFNSDDLLYYFNEDNTSLQKLVTEKPSVSHLNQVEGAVFQMHQEFLWFKEMEDIVERIPTRKDTRTETRKLFIEEHKQLMKEAEEWVKSTANSCLLVATLIATVAFTAAFTVPGGNNGNNGVPLFNSFDLIFNCNSTVHVNPDFSIRQKRFFVLVAIAVGAWSWISLPFCAGNGVGFQFLLVLAL
ncbi:ankyrin repeat-containing protein ITN1 [Cucumis sativus]|uniref:ankyrin repeat-containing protein ITN1 n=1 Tax=Cucumis sativus TaxID=3659 RepID=UPI0012F48555|nr:ankyrin repeat-containing protein ITN1 [Cucumis sativus]